MSPSALRDVEHAVVRGRVDADGARLELGQELQRARHVLLPAASAEEGHVVLNVHRARLAQERAAEVQTPALHRSLDQTAVPGKRNAEYPTTTVRS